MNWTVRALQGLILGGLWVGGCSPTSEDPPTETEGEGESGTSMATTAGESSSSGETSAADGTETGSEGGSSTTGAALPCAWVESTFEADIDPEMTPSDVACDPETTTATLRVALKELSCGRLAEGDRLTIELPPELQVAGEYDLTQLVARIYVSADLEPVAGQVDTGRLIITEVTPTMVVGRAQGGRQGYDFVGSFEAPYCP